MAKEKKDSKTESKKVEKKKPSGEFKITKPNGKVIYRENLEGMAEGYKAKGWKVEEV